MVACLINIQRGMFGLLCYDYCMSKEALLAFIQKHELAIISTVSPEGKPEAAVVEFVAASNFKLIFDTSSYTRKYSNLKNNPSVAFVIGWDNNVTAQYEGTAKELSGKELQEAKQIYFSKIPKALKWGNNPDIAFFKVSPVWIRVTDLNRKPWGVNEYEFGK